MVFQTAYGYMQNPPQVGEIGSGEVLVEADGYRSIEAQVNEFLNAGENLINFRREQYAELEEGTEDDFEPSLEAMRPDAAEVTQMAQEITEKFNRSEAELLKRKLQAEERSVPKRDEETSEVVEK